jgi:cobalt-zinc-cadmium efflux system protein
LADAGHNLSDESGLLLAWGAAWLTRRRSSQRYTYGFRRSSILAALLNGSLLLAAIAIIAWEAVQRLLQPTESPGTTIIAVALVGVGINTATALLFLRDRHHDLNLRSAFWHMAADALVSLGVVLAGLAVLLTGWRWVDPAISLVIVALVGVGTWHLVQEAVSLVLDGVPAAIDPLGVKTYLTELPGVVAVHDLHIWAISTTEPALTAHLVMPAGSPGDLFLAQVQRDLHDRFGIEHVTIQIERGQSLIGCSQEMCCE